MAGGRARVAASILDADLGNDGRDTMRRLLTAYPGVVILASDNPEQIVTPTHTWRPDDVHQRAPLRAPGTRSERAS